MTKTGNAAKSIDPHLARAILADFKLGSALETIARRRHVSKETVRKVAVLNGWDPASRTRSNEWILAHREAAERANAASNRRRRPRYHNPAFVAA